MRHSNNTWYFLGQFFLTPSSPSTGLKFYFKKYLFESWNDLDWRESNNFAPKQGFPNFSNHHNKIFWIASKSGVSNSNVSGGHITKKNARRATVYQRKGIAGRNLNEKWKNLIKIYNFGCFWDVRGSRVMFEAPALSKLTLKRNHACEIPLLGVRQLISCLF